jgi:hypothetical protein
MYMQKAQAIHKDVEMYNYQPFQAVTQRRKEERERWSYGRSSIVPRDVLMPPLPSSCTKVMMEANIDITVFNTKVRKLLNSYFANKRVTFDEQALLTNPMYAYKKCKDNEFVACINQNWQDTSIEIT